MLNNPDFQSTAKPVKANTNANNSTLSRIVTCGAFVSGLICPNLAAETPFLPLYQALDQALEMNLGLEAERFQEESSRYEEAIARATFDPRFELRGSQSIRQEGVASSDLDGSARPRNETATTRAILRQRAIYGTDLTLEHVLSRRESNSRRAILNPAVDADVSLNITQPLLRNAGRSVNLAGINRGILTREQAIFDLERATMDIILETEINYYRLSVAEEEVKLRQLSLEIAERLRNDSQLRREAGAGTRLDVLRAEVRVAATRENILQAIQQRQNQRDSLLNLTGRFAQLEDFDQPFQVAPVTIDPNEVVVDTEIALQNAISNDPQRQVLLRRINQLTIDEEVARNRRQPNLDLGGTLAFSGREEDFGGAFREISEGNGYFWQVDLSLSMPWGLREDRARFRQARLSRLREETLLNQLDQSIAVRVREATRAVETARQRLLVASQGTRLSEEQLQLEEERYQAGAGTSREVLDAQEDFESARLQQLRATIDLQEAQARLRRLEGQTLTWHGLMVDFN